MNVVGIISLAVIAIIWLSLGFMVGSSIPWRGRWARELATGIFAGTLPLFILFFLAEGAPIYRGFPLTLISWYVLTGALGWRHRIWMEQHKRRLRWIRPHPLHRARGMRSPGGSQDLQLH